MEEQKFRNKITWFHFICCLLVVWNHAGNVELFLGKVGREHPLMRLEYEIFPALIRFNIPCFLMLSGYLFYRGFKWEKLSGKWKRRVKTLLIPYLCWNFLYYIGYLIGSKIPYLDVIVNRPGMRFSIKDALWATIHYTCNPVFWFMFQLILLVILAPVIYLLMRFAGIGVAVMALLFAGICFKMTFPQLNPDALLYYFLAAFLALHGRKWVEAPWSGKRAVTGVFLLAAGFLISIGYYRYYKVGAIVVYHMLTVAGLWLLVDEDWLFDAKPWMQCTFFIYAFHFIPVRFLNKAVAMFLPGCEAAAWILYLLMPLIILVMGYQVARVMRHFLPRTWNLLNGSR